jgi:hypothetical protein
LLNRTPQRGASPRSGRAKPESTAPYSYWKSECFGQFRIASRNLMWCFMALRSPAHPAALIHFAEQHASTLSASRRVPGRTGASSGTIRFRTRTGRPGDSTTAEPTRRWPCGLPTSVLLRRCDWNCWNPRTIGGPLPIKKSRNIGAQVLQLRRGAPLYSVRRCASRFIIARRKHLFAIPKALHGLF